MTSPYNPSLISGGIVDVYHGDNGNQPISWGIVARANPPLRAVIAKASQGATGTDPRWASNRQGVLAAGLLLGAYHFCTSDDPDAQVDHFLSVVGDASGVLLALDWELPDPERPTFEPATIEQVEQMAARIRAKTGRVPMIYTGRAVPSRVSEVLSACPLWLAEYGSDPVCPPGWDEWSLHQFTDAETVAGIHGAVDASMHDDTHQTLAEMWAALAHAPSTAPPPPVPTSAPVPTDVAAIIAALQDPAVVRSIQEVVGAEADGVLGPETAEKIRGFRA